MHDAIKVLQIGPRAATVTVHEIDEETGWTRGGRRLWIDRRDVPLCRLSTARTSLRQAQVAGFLDQAEAGSPYGLVGHNGAAMRRYTTSWARKQLAAP